MSLTSTSTPMKMMAASRVESEMRPSSRRRAVTFSAHCSTAFAVAASPSHASTSSIMIAATLFVRSASKKGAKMRQPVVEEETSFFSSHVTSEYLPCFARHSSTRVASRTSEAGPLWSLHQSLQSSTS